MDHLSTNEILAILAARGVKGIDVAGGSTVPVKPAAGVEPGISARPATLAQLATPSQLTQLTTQPAVVAQSALLVKRAPPAQQAIPVECAAAIEREHLPRLLSTTQPAVATQHAASAPATTARQTTTPNPSNDSAGSTKPSPPNSVSRSSTPVQSTVAQATAPSRPTASSRAVRINASNGPLASSRSNRPSTESPAPGDTNSSNPQHPRPKIPILRKLTATESETLQRQLTQLRSGGRTIDVQFIGLKPTNLKGSHTKVSQIRDALGLSEKDYDIVRDITKYALEHTPGIDMSQTSKKQMMEELIDAAVEQTLLALPEFGPYKIFGNWPLKLIASKVLRNTTNGFQTRVRPKKPKPEIQESKQQESEQQTIEPQHLERAHLKPQDSDAQEFEHGDKSNNPPGNVANNATINTVTERLATPYNSQAVEQLAATVPPSASLGDIAALTRNVDDMSIDTSRTPNDDIEPTPFSLPPDLVGTQTQPYAMDIEPNPAPALLSIPPAPTQPTDITITSTATATATGRSISKATSTVSAPSIPTSTRAPSTPLRSRDSAPISPNVLAKIQDLRRALSISQRSRLAPSVQVMLSALDDLDARGLPIDPQAVLAATPGKHNASQPPPYSGLSFNPDDDADNGSELSDIPEYEGGLITDTEDVEMDNDVGPSTNSKGKQRGRVPAARTKQVSAAGGKGGGSSKKGKAAATPPAAGGLGSSSATQDQPARRSTRQASSGNVAAAPAPKQTGRPRKK
ncbi:hypothetical protein RhiLY_10274 [Ceratobasidium sp. AG-Ba]|nr:hypothetical protein RhiLY_10274 [Ceratobasidium sp. AG-Ba]